MSNQPKSGARVLSHSETDELLAQVEQQLADSTFAHNDQKLIAQNQMLIIQLIR